MKKKSTILLALFIFLQSITSAGFFDKNCAKSCRSELAGNTLCCSSQISQTQEETGFSQDPLHFFLFSF